MTMQQPNCFAAGDIAGSTTAWLSPELVDEILSSPRRGYEWSSLSTSPLGFISHWTLTEGAVYVTGISGDFMWSTLQPIKASWISG
jgi:hypothetical protein